VVEELDKGAPIPNADEFIREALTSRIAVMLDDLGQPPLITRIFPKGWRNEDRSSLIALYELCRRTFAKRETDNG
jgi:hypothetical protein